MGHPESEELGDDAFGDVLFVGQRRAEVEIFIKKIFGLFALRVNRGAESGQTTWMAANVVQRLDSSFRDALLRGSDQIVDKTVENALQSLVELQFLGGFWISLLHLAIKPRENGYSFANFVERQQVRFVAIVEVGGVVGDLISEVDELGLERRALVEKVFGEFRMLFRGVIVRMLDDALADFEGQVETAEGSVALLEVFDD